MVVEIVRHSTDGKRRCEIYYAGLRKWAVRKFTRTRCRAALGGYAWDARKPTEWMTTMTAAQDEARAWTRTRR